MILNRRVRKANNTTYLNIQVWNFNVKSRATLYIFRQHL